MHFKESGIPGSIEKPYQSAADVNPDKTEVT